jgi:hypothetical protein
LKGNSDPQTLCGYGGGRERNFFLSVDAFTTAFKFDVATSKCMIWMSIGESGSSEREEKSMQILKHAFAAFRNDKPRGCCE